MSRGSIHQEPNGKWRARYRNPDGRSRSRNFDRKIDAERHLTSMEHSKLVGSYIDPSEGRVTFKSYAERWSASQVHRVGTASQIETNLRLHVYPRIGERPIGAVRSSDVQGLIKALDTVDKNGSVLAPSTIGTIYVWVAAIFKAAVADRVIHASPCVQIRLPEVHQSKVKPLKIETVQQIVAAVPDRYKALIVFGAATGVRISEALGVTLDRVDFLHRTVTIDRQLRGTVDNEPVFGPVKDRKNRPRLIPLPDVALDALGEHLSSWPAASGSLVFRNERERPIRRTTFSDMWRKAVGPLGLSSGEGYHELRHFYASLLIRHGESVKVVQERLGHTSAQMTLDVYSHLWPDSDDSTRAAVDLVFGDPTVSDSCQTVGT